MKKKQASLLMGIGFLIFRKVLITIYSVEAKHKSIRLSNNTIRTPAITAPRLLWLSTGVAWLTSPRRLILTCESKNTIKNKEECNQFADE